MKNGNGFQLFVYDENDTFGSRIEKLRMEHKLSQQKTADKVGCSYKTYRNYVKDRIPHPDTINLLGFANLYNVSVDFLLCRTHEKNFGNNRISEITGLTETSIETLRYLCSVPSSPYNDVATINNMTVDMINRVLSDKGVVERIAEQKVNKHPFPVETLFTDLRRYLYFESATGKAYSGEELIQFDTLSVNGSDKENLCTASDVYEALQFQHIIEKLTGMKKQQSTDSKVTP